MPEKQQEIIGKIAEILKKVNALVVNLSSYIKSRHLLA